MYPGEKQGCPVLIPHGEYKQNSSDHLGTIHTLNDMYVRIGSKNNPPHQWKEHWDQPQTCSCLPQCFHYVWFRNKRKVLLPFCPLLREECLVS